MRTMKNLYWTARMNLASARIARAYRYHDAVVEANVLQVATALRLILSPNPKDRGRRATRAIRRVGRLERRHELAHRRLGRAQEHGYAILAQVEARHLGGTEEVEGYLAQTVREAP